LHGVPGSVLSDRGPLQRVLEGGEDTDRRVGAVKCVSSTERWANRQIAHRKRC
jgi:hypothetical protein